MSGEQQLSGPDLGQGVSTAEIGANGCLLGHAGGEPVLLARVGEELFAIAANCTHYGGPLAEGLLVGDTVRCPWHHACFSLRTGEPLRAPALNPVTRYRVERQGERVAVREKLPPATPPPCASAARVMPAPSPWSAPRSRRPTTAPTSRRTTWPATPRRSGYRCIRASSTPSAGSSCVSVRG